METKKVLFGLVVAFVVVWLLRPSVLPKQLGGAPSGLSATVATSSQASVGTTATTIFATSTNCAARVISTVADPIMLTFNDYKGEVPSGTYGYLQAASTTVAYDAEIYGCGAFKAFGFTASNTIHVFESR